MNLMLGDCLERMKEIPSGSIDLILTDPPYIGMVNEKWDRLSDTQAVSFFDECLLQSERVLRHGGRLVSFASNDTLKYLYRTNLKHRELLIIEKNWKQVAAGRNTKQYKQHINHVEYVFICTKYARAYTRDLLLSANSKLNLSSKEINEKLGNASNGGGMWSIYTGNNKCNQVPTESQWNKFKSIFDLPEYESFHEVYNNISTRGNVINDFNFNIKDRKHPTQKPIDLMEYLIKTYTNESDTVLDFTMGSGTTGVACVNTNRDFIGIEMDEGYFKIAQDRINETKKGSK